MSIVDRNILKGYFDDGDVPNESNYVDLIDSIFVRGDNLEAKVLNLYSTSNLSYQVVEIPYQTNNPGIWFHLCSLKNQNQISNLRLDLWAHQSERPNTTSDYKGASVHIIGNGWGSTGIHYYNHEILGGISDTNVALAYFAIYVDGVDINLYLYAPRYSNFYVSGIASGTIIPTPLNFGVSPSGTLYYSTLNPGNMRRSIGDLQLNGNILGGVSSSQYGTTSTKVGWSSFTDTNIRYLLIGKLLFIDFYIAGTSNSTSSSFTLPYSVPTNQYGWRTPCRVTDNGVLSASPGLAEITIANPNVVNLYKTMSSTAWTASGTKMVSGQFFVILS